MTREETREGLRLWVWLWARAAGAVRCGVYEVYDCIVRSCGGIQSVGTAGQRPGCRDRASSQDRSTRADGVRLKPGR